MKPTEIDINSTLYDAYIRYQGYHGYEIKQKTDSCTIGKAVIWYYRAEYEYSFYKWIRRIGFVCLALLLGIYMVAPLVVGEDFQQKMTFFLGSMGYLFKLWFVVVMIGLALLMLISLGNKARKKALEVSIVYSAWRDLKSMVCKPVVFVGEEILEKVG